MNAIVFPLICMAMMVVGGVYTFRAEAVRDRLARHHRPGTVGWRIMHGPVYVLSFRMIGPVLILAGAALLLAPLWRR